MTDTGNIKCTVEFYRASGRWQIVIKGPRWLLEDIDRELRPDDGAWHALFLASGPIIREGDDTAAMLFHIDGVIGNRLSVPDRAKG